MHAEFVKKTNQVCMKIYTDKIMNEFTVNDSHMHDSKML